MSAESGWAAAAIGASAGVLGWVVGLGKILWPQHPQWALFFIIIGVTAVSTPIVEWNDRRSDKSEDSQSKAFESD
jgi:hypothetical protein